MPKPYQTFKINRNILLFKWMDDKIRLGNPVRKTFKEAALFWGVSYNLARSVFYYPNYPFSPFVVFDENGKATEEKRDRKEILSLYDKTAIEMSEYLESLESKQSA